MISIHAPRVGCDSPGHPEGKTRETFQSTHPVWGATRGNQSIQGNDRFQSTHPVWGATLVRYQYITASRFQSTHPVWGATVLSNQDDLQPSISIHAPRVGCDVAFLVTRKPLPPFQSTHPVWGATTTARSWPGLVKFQSTHPVWGATPPGQAQTPCSRISIHAPRVGCDSTGGVHKWNPLNFNPRTPCGVRRWPGNSVPSHLQISIHAPRVGCDLRTTADGRTSTDFNPRTPCGVRQTSTAHLLQTRNFNPRTPCGVRHGISLGLWP